MIIPDNLPGLNLSNSLIKTLSDHGTVKTLQAGETVLREDSYIQTIPIVIKGSIKVLRTEEDGREILLYYIKPGESCIMSFLGGIHQETSKIKAIADEETEILFVAISKIVMLNKENNEWLDYIFRLYHKRFEELLEVVNAVTFKKVDERLIKLLKIKSEMNSNNTLNITHEQLANELGTVRVVVSRLLKQMEEKEILKLGRNKITLL